MDKKTKGLAIHIKYSKPIVTKFLCLLSFQKAIRGKKTKGLAIHIEYSKPIVAKFLCLLSFQKAAFQSEKQ